MACENEPKKEAGIITRAKEASIEYMVEILYKMCCENPELYNQIQEKAQSIIHSKKACTALGVDYVRMSRADGLRVDYYAYLAIAEEQDPLADLIFYG